MSSELHISDLSEKIPNIISDLNSDNTEDARVTKKSQHPQLPHRKERGFHKSAGRQYSGEVLTMEKRRHTPRGGPFKRKVLRTTN